MEQAINQFSKGLQLDTHPIVQGNDSLSDALNATFVTMNGNEVVLQNDMGNRKVDNAFLPPGFEPVGIKEYGGIIYVASYNPITNRSQIGSFPSPERKINSLDDKSLGCKFNLFEHFFSNFPIPNERRFIKSDTVLIPLTGDTSLHAGDKFVIYSNEVLEWKKYLSNYENIIGSKPLSPKNNYITLSVGVLNSQNQFVDITKNLKRWDNDLNPAEIIKYDNNSENYIFNKGYFIASSFNQDTSSYTIDDRQLIRERQTIPANTYAYKLVGPLYLKAQLNHIQEFAFDIRGDKELSKKKLHIRITANIIYNCPDSLTRSGNSIEDYVYDGTGTPPPNTSWVPFDFFIQQNDGQYILQNSTYTYGESTYFNGNYQTKVILDWEVSDYANLDGILNYFIGVDSGIPTDEITDGKRYYIETLSAYGSLDLSKLNSGQIDIKGFRFFNSLEGENSISIINCTLESYPKLDQTFSNLTLELTDVEEPNTLPIEIASEVLNNGRNLFSFNWKEVKKNRLYIVKFKYEGGDYPYIQDSDGNDIKRWFLSTELFNDCYNQQSENFVEDFGEKVDSSNEILYKKLEIDLGIEHNAEIKISDPEFISDAQNSLIKQGDSGTIEYYDANKYHLTGKIDDRIKIENSELYPNSLKILNDKLQAVYSNKDMSNLNIEIVGEHNKIISDKKEIEYNNNTYDIISTTGIENLSGDILDGYIECKNRILSKSNLENGNRIINNGFNLINSNDFKEVIKSSTSYSGFFVTNWDERGDDDHIFALALNREKAAILLKDEGIVQNLLESSFYFNDPNEDNAMSAVTFGDPRIAAFYDEMGGINNSATFAYLFSSVQIIGNVKYDTRPLAYVQNVDVSGWAGVRNKDGGNLGYCPITACKVWWRNGNSDEWVLLNNESGLFGGNRITEGIDKLPEKLPELNGQYIYVGDGSEWTENHNHRGYYNDDISGNTYYEILYNGDAGTSTMGGINVISGIEDLVRKQIAEFLDPDKKIVYKMYKKTDLSSHNLFTVNPNDYTYNRPYSGELVIQFLHEIPSNGTINTVSNENNTQKSLYVKKAISDILPFYTSKLEDSETKFKVDIESQQDFEDNVRDIVNNDIISNIFIGNNSGILKDKNGQRLNGNTIYKLENNELIAINNPPYRVYEATGNDYNSLVSTVNYNGSSSPLSRYIRAMGDKDSMTALKFSGGRLKVVNQETFKNL